MSSAMTATTSETEVAQGPAAGARARATLGPSGAAVAATCSLDMLPPHTGARLDRRALAAYPSGRGPVSLRTWPGTW